MIRKLLFGGGVIAIVILLFIGLEFFLRPRGASLREATILDYSFSSAVLGDFRPNQDLTSTLKPALPYHVTINIEGYRGAAVAIPKPRGTFRILLLGDSFVEGPFVNDEDTLSIALERFLNGALPNRAIEVVNAGHSGYTITDERDYYNEKGYRFDPDVVVLVFGPNDVADLTKPIQAREFLKITERTGETHPISRATQKATRHSAILTRVASFATSMIVKLNIRSPGPINPEALRERLDQGLIYVPNPSPEVTRWFERYQTLLLEFAERLKEERKRFLFVLFPTSNQMPPEEPGRPQEVLSEFARAHGVAVADLLPLMREQARNGEKLYLDPHDYHPTPLGYKRAAAGIGQALLTAKRTSNP